MTLKKAALLAFLFGALLRVILALVNSEANDDHLDVVRVMADESRIPAKTEISEAFQPKLYHATVAALWKILPTQSPAIRIRIGQMVSCAAGIATLFLALRFFTSESSLSPKVGLLSFSLLALNPRLIGINAQATNDSFVILFGSMAVYFGYRFFQTHRTRAFIWMTAGTIAAALSKGNGLVVFLAILGVFAVRLFRPSSDYPLSIRKTVWYGSAFIVSFLAVVPAVGPYWEHYRKYGSPFVTNSTVAPFPHFLERTAWGYPGVTSIVDSFLTFRLLDLLENPVTSPNQTTYPLHRTSLWSQLYGRTHYVHFVAWPPSWQLPRSGYGRLVRHLGRAILVCALFPTLLLVVAIAKRGAAVSRCLLRSGKEPWTPLSAWLLDLTVFGYIAFIVWYSLRYRNYQVMKAIFLFPGVLAFFTLFAQQCEQFYAWCNQKRAVRLSTDVTFILLLLLYVADVSSLIGQLSIELLR